MKNKLSYIVIAVLLILISISLVFTQSSGNGLEETFGEKINKNYKTKKSSRNAGNSIGGGLQKNLKILKKKRKNLIKEFRNTDKVP